MTRFQLYKIQLAQGGTLFHIYIPKAKQFVIQSSIPVGLLYENKQNNGISHLLEHMMFRGNTKIGKNKDLHLHIESLGGEMNAATSTDFTEYWLYTHVKYTKKAIQSFCDFLQYPLFENLEIEKQIIKEEILEDFNQEGKIINCDRLTMKAFWEKDIAGSPIIGTQEKMIAMTEPMLQDWFKQHYSVANINFASCGDILPNEVQTCIEASLMPSRVVNTKKQYNVSEPKAIKGKQIICCNDNDSQYTLQWSFALPAITKPIKTAILLITAFLDDGFSSLLQYEMRENSGIAYSIQGSHYFVANHLLWQLSTTISEAKLKLFLQKITTLFSTLKDGALDKEKFQLVKERFLLHIDYIQDNPEEILTKELYSCLPHALTITKQDILTIEYDFFITIVKRLFSSKNTVFVIIGNQAEQKEKLIYSYINQWLY